MLLINATNGVPVLGGLHYISVFAAPLPGKQQYTVIRCIIVRPDTCSDNPLLVMIPVPSPCTAMKTDISGTTKMFEALHGCFPHSAPLAGVKGPHSTLATDTERADEDAEAEQQHAVKRAKGSESSSSHVAEEETVDAAILRMENIGASCQRVGVLEAAEQITSTLRDSFCKLYASHDIIIARCNPPTDGTAGQQLAFDVQLVHSRPAADALWIPLRGTIPDTIDDSTFEPSYLSGAGTDISLYSLGTLRRSNWSGGGKTGAEMFEDMRHRFASGSLRRLEAASFEWDSIRTDSGIFPEILRNLFKSTHVKGKGSSDHKEASAESSAEPHERRHRVSFSEGSDKKSAADTPISIGVLSTVCCTDVLRVKKIVAGPNIDVCLALDLHDDTDAKL